MKNKFCCLLLTCLSVVFLSCGSEGDNTPFVQPVTGWTIGWADNKVTGVQTVKILRTSNGGTSWSLQTLPAECEGYHGNDISAVTHQVAWAAMGNSGTETVQGGILHTADGGATWTVQTLPDSMITRHIKSIKGVSPTEAWAVSLQGDVLHTTDGGATWQLVPVQTASGDPIVMTQVNRMDVIGQDVWIVDIPAGELGVIHSPDGGLTWWQEFLPGKGSQSTGPLAISAYNSLVAWAAMNQDGLLWWTSNGGRSWNKSNDSIAATADFDDICASSANVVWIACNGSGGGGGFTARVTVTNGNFETISTHHPPYMMEGVSPMTDNKAWAVGQKAAFAEPDLPMSSIYLTEDGGTTWQSQPLPGNARDVTLWKVSFVGAKR